MPRDLATLANVYFAATFRQEVLPHLARGEHGGEDDSVPTRKAANAPSIRLIKQRAASRVSLALNPSAIRTGVIRCPVLKTTL